MIANIQRKDGPTKKYLEKKSGEQRIFKIPAVFLYKCHITPRLHQLKIATYAYLKYYRSGAAPEATLIKNIPRVFQSNFQSNRRSAVLQAIQELVLDGTLVRYESAQGSWIKIQKFEKMG